MRRHGFRVGKRLLLLAVCLRLLEFGAGLWRPVQASLRSPEFRRLTLSLLAAAEQDTKVSPETTVWVMHKLTSKEAVSAPTERREELTFLAADAKAVTVAGSCSYTTDKLSLLQRETPIQKSESPTVLIVHTHTSEAYTPSSGYQYAPTDSYRTLSQEHSVVAVGAEVKRVLESRGISVIHDTTVNDYPDYNGSYTRTGERIRRYLEEYPSLQVVLDLHRDAVVRADGTPLKTAVTLPDGTRAAQLMLVVGTDQGGAQHPAWQENLAWALKTQVLLERQSPGICRNLDLRTERFNQHYTEKSMLVEVGSISNTLPEALTAARLFATALAELMLASTQ